MVRRVVVSAVLLLAGPALVSCGSGSHAENDFCAAVARAPLDDASLARTRAAAAEVEQVAPSEVRADVTAIREALETVSTPAEVDALDGPGGPVRAASERYHAYVEEHC